MKTKYWDMCVKEIEELENYRDAHPAFVTDEKRAASHQQSHKGISGLVQISTEEYFKRIHKREEKAIELCKHMRDRVEELETALLTSIMKMHRQNQRKIEKVCFDVTKSMKVHVVVDGC